MKIINLLPKIRQKELMYERLFSKSLKLVWLAVAGTFLVVGLQIGVKIYLQRQMADVQKEIESLKSQVSKSENDEIRQTIKKVNGYITDYKTLSTSPKWSKVLDAFSKLPPPEVGIGSMQLDLAKRTVRIQGFAPTRESVIELYERIKADSENFENIDYPLENVAKPTDNSFHFTFTIKESLIQ